MPPGSGRGALRLDLVYNPIGASLPPPQAELEAQYRDELARNFGIVFDRLLTITNMPIARFANQLSAAGNHAAYMSLLVNHFNPATVDALMCRDLVSVGWDGRLYDCDFNQMLEIPLGASAASTIWDVDDVGDTRRRAHRDRIALFRMHRGRGLELWRRNRIRRPAFWSAFT